MPAEAIQSIKAPTLIIIGDKEAITMDIVFSSTTQLAAAIRAGHVSATEVIPLANPFL